MARGRRRSGGRRSGGLDWAPPVPGAPTLAERLESGDLPVGLTAEEVAEALPQLFEGLAPNTKEAYAKFARYFQQWCLPRGIRLEQVETAHIRTYMRAARRRRVRPVSVSWLWSTLAGVRLSMRFEGLSGRVNWNELADFVYDEHLEGKSPPVQADGLTWELISEVSTAAWIPKDYEWPEQTRRRATMDIALVMLMWGCLLRRSEAACIRWGDISTEVVGGHVYGVLKINSSKTDPLAKGEVGYIHLNTLAALQDMAVACGRDPSDPRERVFGIGGQQICNRIRDACAHAGLRGRWSGHSPRVGASQDLMRYGFSLLETMHAGRWSRPETVSRYVRGIAMGYGGMARMQDDRGPGQMMLPCKIGVGA